ncbi:Uncharacterized protein dnm_036970 [Desulfonema magnum]|uniref:Uncharacterized protein n=1 Tax=Desulfonema magnum TaxID=45655 RepID=A0A975BM28_9BACT|nr:Uncharacterized protein dnm_036970 [Desulfonema magnum]
MKGEKPGFFLCGREHHPGEKTRVSFLVRYQKTDGLVLKNYRENG